MPYRLRSSLSPAPPSSALPRTTAHRPERPPPPHLQFLSSGPFRCEPLNPHRFPIPCQSAHTPCPDRALPRRTRSSSWQFLSQSRDGKLEPHAVPALPPTSPRALALPDSPFRTRSGSRL